MDKNIFVISDTWFNRPFGEKSEMTVDEYNNEIIKKWNECVGQYDDIYVLGGFGISELYNIGVKLNGIIHFLNNYYTNDEKFFIDKFKTCINNAFDKNIKNKFIFENEQILSLNDDDVIISYFPLLNWYGKDTGTLCFHGLTRESNFNDGNICCMFSVNEKPLNIKDTKNKLEDFSNIILN